MYVFIHMNHGYICLLGFGCTIFEENYDILLNHENKNEPVKNIEMNIN